MTGLDTVQTAFDELYPAFAAGTIAGAGSVNGHIGPAGSFQQVIPGVAGDGDGSSALNFENHFTHIGAPFILI